MTFKEIYSENKGLTILNICCVLMGIFEIAVGILVPFSSEKSILFGLTSNTLFCITGIALIFLGIINVYNLKRKAEGKDPL